MKSNEIFRKAQIVYFSHGGGPLPLLGDSSHQEMNKFMKKLPSRLKKPEAIVVISAHWEEDVVTIQGAKHPKMLYDYYGFPEEAYEIEYPAMGSPIYAAKIEDILKRNNIENRTDNERGFDHGLFVPLKMMYPKADIPAFQISLLRGLDAGEHINLGKAISELLRENILIIGSGFSFHNLSAFSFAGDRSDPSNDAFQDWLIDVCTGDMPQEERETKLIEWEAAPSARYCHPRHEHLLPLHVCAGIARGKAQMIFDDYIAGKRAVAFLWE